MASFSAGQIERAHPRSRGEHPVVKQWGTRLRGSSPLTRGTRKAPFTVRTVRGLIPAHAGNTTYEAGDPYTPGAHPRSRGEHRVKAWIGGTLPGSSPLTRGTPVIFDVEGHGLGLIPAHAGNTLADKARHPTEEQKIFSFLQPWLLLLSSPKNQEYRDTEICISVFHPRVSGGGYLLQG